MLSAKIEISVWMLGLALFGWATLNPRALIQFLGRGRVSPSSGTYTFFRLVAGFCFVGTIFRLFELYRPK